MMKISGKRRRQVIGSGIGVLLTLITVVVFSLPSNEELLSKGEYNTGHENLACNDCHYDAQGNVFQQLQANISWMFGARNHTVAFGTLDVDTKKCQGCHDRPNDRHPVHRFKEPRFADARKAINPTECESCHLEHSGMRMTRTETGFCINCHEDLEIKNDPLDVPHVELIANSEWTTCLQCHDFHGNHKMEVPEQMKDTISMSAIKAYIEGGKDPYSATKKYSPKEKPEDELTKNY